MHSYPPAWRQCAPPPPATSACTSTPPSPAPSPEPSPRSSSTRTTHQWDWLGQSYRIDQRRNLVFGDFAKRFAVLRAQTAVGRRALHRGHAGPLQEPRTL
ncbi:endo-alpha-N-acetylgalactosaminidase family protein [Streptomyces chrestomyceticus]|uniref:endo-alpha-N-acetylgalactosaminidase family protein n=1 Tax=Streptomyces chrestomyceticus TaxID=68185 RepID=UPI0033F8F7D9